MHLPAYAKHARAIALLQHSASLARDHSGNISMCFLSHFPNKYSDSTFTRDARCSRAPLIRWIIASSSTTYYRIFLFFMSCYCILLTRFRLLSLSSLALQNRPSVYKRFAPASVSYLRDPTIPPSERLQNLTLAFSLSLILLYIIDWPTAE